MGPTSNTVPKVNIVRDGLPPYTEKTKTTRKVQTKHLVVCGVVALFLVAIVIGGALFGVYMQNNHVENLVTEMTIQTKYGAEHIRVDPEKGEEEFELGDSKFSILYDFKRGITVYRTSVSGSPACYLQPLNRARMMSPAALANYTKQGGEIMDLEPEEEYYYLSGIQSQVKDTSILGDRARSICGGLPVYWMKLDGPYSKPIEHGDRQRRSAPPARCIVIMHDCGCVTIIIVA